MSLKIFLEDFNYMYKIEFEREYDSYKSVLPKTQLVNFYKEGLTPLEIIRDYCQEDHYPPMENLA